MRSIIQIWRPIWRQIWWPIWRIREQRAHGRF
jgi:hypothetical protein